MTDAPKRIWAHFEPHRAGGHPVVFATAEKTKAQEYVRADIADDMLKALKVMLEAAEVCDWEDGFLDPVRTYIANAEGGDA